jgi:AraC family transcriptional regulator
MSDTFCGLQPNERAGQAIVANLLGEALKLLDGDVPGARRKIEDACRLVVNDRPDCGKNGLLADWQLQRAQKYILDHLDSRVRIGPVAKIVNLSPSYFSRAFKATKGIPFSDFVLMSRVELAKHLLSTTDRPIAQIALDCGLADQSHLTRIFNRAVGTPPRAWRCRRMADLRSEEVRRYAAAGVALPQRGRGEQTPAWD